MQWSFVAQIALSLFVQQSRVYACVAADNWRAGVTPDQWFGASLGDDAKGADFTSFLEEEPTIVARRGNRLGGDWTDLGHAGVNNYGDMWFARNVY
ncbi:MAG: hypothetical protein ACRYGL_02185 [Janthinobacterium lividum]